MAPLPKPRQRVRQGTTQAHWRALPPVAPFNPPVADKDWLKTTKGWWKALWASPMATTYLEADLPALRRLAEMVEARARGELGASETIAMTALEDRFGLSPKARRALQWEIAQAGEAQPSRPKNVAKLRVVDDGAA